MADSTTNDKSINYSNDDFIDSINKLDKAEYDKEREAYFASLSNYFYASEDYTKSRMHYALAVIGKSYLSDNHISYSKSLDEKLAEAYKVISKDLSGENAIPYVDGTETFINALKPIDIAIKHGVAPASIIKAESEKWHDIIIKNVDFAKVEKAIESKEMLNYINFVNCKFLNCNIENIQHFNISKENNEILKGVQPKMSTNSVVLESDKIRTEFGSIHARLVVHDEKNNGNDVYFFPASWVKNSKSGRYLEIPDVHKHMDIIKKPANGSKLVVASSEELLSATLTAASQLDNSIHRNSSKFKEDALRKEDTLRKGDILGAKGFKQFAKEVFDKSKVPLKSKKQSAQKDKGLILGD